ncbi:MAG: glycine cleavage system aminomethyltransferase GcvT [Deltaproteobacteria bacterium]|nr:glycine cleavage system aminomethyltransferase GcvT [Deltaproteobacteria bacterium]
MNKRTPLFAQHLQAEAKFLTFAGYDMPIEYVGILKEHAAVRTAAGLFDVSHMGRIECRGRDAAAFLQGLTTNDVHLLTDGQAQYSFFCNERGGIIDDFILYRVADDRYRLIVNAANLDTDWHWLIAHRQGDLQLKNQTEATALLALQGPLAESILQPFAIARLADYPAFHFCETHVHGLPAVVARTGYTGEAGFEITVAAPDAAAVWKALLAAGAKQGLIPCGLGARDTLRLEMGYRLHGHDMTDQTTPWEAGLDWVVKLGKGEFLGREALVKQRASGLRRVLVGFRMVDPGIPREGYSIIEQRKPIGYATSGTLSPTLRKGIGLGYVPQVHSALGTKFFIDIRGKERLAEVTSLPFVATSS